MVKLLNEKKVLKILKIFTNQFYKSNFFRDYTKLFFDASYEAKQNETEKGGTGLKILTPKQMLQRLPIALTQVKAGNNSESL